MNSEKLKWKVVGSSDLVELHYTCIHAFLNGWSSVASGTQPTVEYLWASTWVNAQTFLAFSGQNIEKMTHGGVVEKVLASW